jgi:hypothetical protein
MGGEDWNRPEQDIPERTVNFRVAAIPVIRNDTDERPGKRVIVFPGPPLSAF